MWKASLFIIALASALGAKPLRRWFEASQGRAQARRHGKTRDAEHRWEDEGGRAVTPEAAPGEVGEAAATKTKTARTSRPRRADSKSTKSTKTTKTTKPTTAAAG